MEIMRPGSGSWSWEGLIVRLREGSEKDYERVGIASNVVLKTSGRFETEQSWFKDLNYNPINLV